MTSCYSIPGWYLMLEGSPTSASNLEWFITEFTAVQRNAVKHEGKSIYDFYNELVSSIGPDESKIVFLPFLYGSNVMPDTKSCFVGLEGWHTQAHVIRAVYEGIVFAHNTHFRRLLKFRGRPEVIRFTGGAARSEVWVQMFADCFQVPVEVPMGTELGARGAAIAAGVACGYFSNYTEAVEAMTNIARRHEPDADVKSLYASKYQSYKKTIEALSSLWKE